MTYSVINPDVYCAAAAGAIAGIADGAGGNPLSNPGSHDSESWSGSASIALAFAQEMDTVWASAEATEFEIFSIMTISTAYWTKGGTVVNNKTTNPTTWQSLCRAIVAQIEAVEVGFPFFPSPWPGGGGGASLVFRPGGDAVPNVYTTEAALARATQNFNGAVYTVLVDLSDSGSPYTFETVGSLDLAPNGIWTDAFAGYQLTFANETTLPTPPLAVEGSLVLYVNQAQTVCTLTKDTWTTFCGYSTAENAGAGHFVDAGEESTWFVLLQDTAGLSGAGITANAATVYAYDDCFLSGPAPEGMTIFSLSSNAAINDSFYPNTIVVGLFIDYSGTATVTIPPSSIENGQAYILESGVLYYSDTESWVAITGGGGGSEGGPTGPIQSGAITVTNTNSYTAVNLGAGNATLNLDQITPTDRLKLRFLLIGESANNTWIASTGTYEITAYSNQSAAQPSHQVQGSGQEVAYVFMAAEGKWYTE